MNFFRRIVVVEGTFTRPANTTTYTAGDVMGDATTGVVTMVDCARVTGGYGFISSIILVDSSNETLNLDADIFVFTTAPAAQADNVAFAATDAEMLECCGVASIVGTDGKESTINVTYNAIMPSPGKIDFVCEAGVDNLFFLMVARNAYIPTSAEVYTFRAFIYQA